MKYFKYIIILILLIICGLLYMQINDYDTISNTLLDDNAKTKEQMEKLQNSIKNINEGSKELQNKINFLYSIIDAKEIEIELLEESCIFKKPIEINGTDTNTTYEENISVPEKITLENENEVTGFE